MIHILRDEERVAAAGVRLIVMLLRDRDRAEEHDVTLALSGGRTPRGVYGLLAEEAEEAAPWERVQLLWGDERCVPREHDQSNFKMVGSTGLLTRPWAGIHPMPGEMVPEEGARAYEETIRELTGASGMPRLDVILLGLGADGHVASLFPDAPLGAARDRLVAATGEYNGFRRLTLTMPVLASAHNLLFVVTGEDKAEAVRLTLGRADPEVSPPPARRLLDMIKVKKLAGWECPTVTWVLDQPAASRLPARSPRLDGGAARR